MWKLIPYLIITFGAVIALLGLPVFKEKTVGRLQEKGLAPKITLKKKDKEFIAGTGPQTALIFFGFVIILIGIFLIHNHV